MNQKRMFNVRNVVLIGMFSALAAVLETLQIPVPFAPPFYKLDFAELPVLVGGFAMGPVPAMLIAVVKNLLKLLINGTSTFYVGEVANALGSMLLSVPAALIYRRHKTKKVAMAALAVSVVIAVIGAVLAVQMKSSGRAEYATCACIAAGLLLFSFYLPPSYLYSFHFNHPGIENNEFPESRNTIKKHSKYFHLLCYL